MFDPTSVIDAVASNGYRNMKRHESDFVGEDGLLYCGICRTKKETYITLKWSGQDKKVPCRCRCEMEKQKSEEVRIRTEEEMDKIRRLKEASLIDSKLKNATFDNFRSNGYNEQNLKLCKRYCQVFKKMFSNNQGLLFYGDVGTGKSFAAACIANMLMSNKIPVIMTSFVKLLELIQGNGKETEILSRINSARLVIFDDLGVERNTDYALEKIYNIIDGRYRSGMPMIVTTNLTADSMLQETDIRYKRIYDRILETCYPMQFTGPSWRMQEAGNRFETMRSLFD